jgi:hypothetical protein
MEGRAPGTIRVWAEPLMLLRCLDSINHAYIALAAQAIVVPFTQKGLKQPPAQCEPVDLLCGREPPAIEGQRSRGFELCSGAVMTE